MARGRNPPQCGFQMRATICAPVRHRSRRNTSSVGAAVCVQTALPAQRSQSSARSFHANAIAGAKIAMNQNMSRNATILIRLKVTADGNMNTISMSKATNSRAEERVAHPGCTRAVFRRRSFLRFHSTRGQSAIGRERQQREKRCDADHRDRDTVLLRYCVRHSHLAHFISALHSYAADTSRSLAGDAAG